MCKSNQQENYIEISVKMLFICIEKAFIQYFISRTEQQLIICKAKQNCFTKHFIYVLFSFIYKLHSSFNYHICHYFNSLIHLSHLNNIIAGDRSPYDCFNSLSVDPTPNGYNDRLNLTMTDFFIWPVYSYLFMTEIVFGEIEKLKRQTKFGSL